MSTALQTDRYELTMLDAALRAGTADTPTVFEVFTRGIPPERPYAVFAGLDRLLRAIESFSFGPAELSFLEAERVVSTPALEWLADYRFDGDVHAYAEGELYTEGSPVLTVEAPFGHAVLLETVILSILNHDCAVASAASRIARAALGKPIIEMGGRRTDPNAAVEAARCAYLAGFSSTSNLEAGRRYGVPTAGTVAHAFVMLFSDERAAFEAQAHSFGGATTYLVDTFDMEQGIRNAVAAAGPSLAAIRVDSGDLGALALRARELLDELGATGTHIIVTGDLDDRAIQALGAAPVDGFGVGTAVTMGLGHPTAGLIYKLVSAGGRPVEKRSPGKRTVGGRKWAWRLAESASEVVGSSPEGVPDGRPLQELVMSRGKRVWEVGLEEARAFHARVVDELPAGERLTLVRRQAG